MARRRKKNENNLVLKAFLRLILAIMLWIILIWSGKFIYQTVKHPEFLTVKHVEVKGKVEYAAVDKIQKAILLHTQDGFLHMDIFSLKYILLNQNWFSQVDIQRFWPDTIAITLKERKPIALWGNESLVDQNLQTFTVNNYPDNLNNLPKLLSEREDAAVLWQDYLMLEALLADLDMHIVYLYEDARGGLTLTLDNNLVLKIGMQNHKTRLLRFIQSYIGIIQNKITEIKYIDLRYHNGFAIGWYKKEDY